MNLRETIQPKSDQLNADDLIAGPVTVTVRDVKRGPNAEQPVEIQLDGHRPYRPCKSMRRVLIACWGDQGKDWVGRSMTLYSDPGVRFGGVAVGGIRISHLSDIDSDKSMMLTTTRSRRAEYRVQRLANAPAAYPDAEFDANVEAWSNAIKAGKISIPGIIQRTAAKGALSAEQINRLNQIADSQKAA